MSAAERLASSARDNKHPVDGKDVGAIEVQLELAATCCTCAATHLSSLARATTSKKCAITTKLRVVRLLSISLRSNGHATKHLIIPVRRR